MDSLTTFIHQMEGSLNKIKRAGQDREITEDLSQCLMHLIYAAKLLAVKEKEKYPNGYLPPPPEEKIKITGMLMVPDGE